jgi:predicted ATPase
VLRGLWHHHLVRGDLQRARELAERLNALAEEHGVPVQRALARRARGTTLFYFGEFPDAKVALDEGIAIDDAVAAWEDPTHLLVYTERAGPICQLFLGRTLWYLGFPDRAVESVEAGLKLGRRIAHRNSLAYALYFGALVHSFRGEFDAARMRAEEISAVARKHHMPQWLAAATMCGGFAMVGPGQQAERIAQIRRGLAAWDAIGARSRPTGLAFIAEAHAQAGQFKDALSWLSQGAESIAATGERHLQAELYRLRGVVLAQTDDAAEAAAWLQKAIDTAQSQQAKSLELRAATSLARLWRDQGKCAQAYDLLAPVYVWFTEGFDTADLKDARALLDALA